jgi:hypothetical protein
MGTVQGGGLAVDSDKNLSLKSAKRVAYSIPRVIKKGVLCEHVLNVDLKKVLNFSGKPALTAKFATESIEKNTVSNIKSIKSRIGCVYGERKNLVNARNAVMDSLVREGAENTVLRNANCLDVLSREKMDVGNGKESFIQMGMRILQITKPTRENTYTELALGYLKVKFQKVFMFAMPVITGNVFVLTTFFWEQLKRICLMPKKKEGWSMLSLRLPKVLITETLNWTKIKLEISAKISKLVFDAQ